MTFSILIGSLKTKILAEISIESGQTVMPCVQSGDTRLVHSMPFKDTKICVQYSSSNYFYSYYIATIDHFTVYESTDDHLNIKLLVGDILHCTVESIGHPFDSIWDCNALVAISPSDRERYVATLTALLKPNGRITVYI